MSEHERNGEAVAPYLDRWIGPLESERDVLLELRAAAARDAG